VIARIQGELQAKRVELKAALTAARKELQVSDVAIEGVCSALCDQ